jgi:hypothetical protein
VSLRLWVVCVSVTVLFACVAFMVWGLGRTLQSLFE